MLSKRESRLILVEEELKQKINETSRQLAQKDMDSESAMGKQQEEKKVLQKKIRDLEDKNKKLEELVKSIEEDLKLYKLEQEKSPVEIIKRELQVKAMEIADLRKELDKTEEIKEEYRKHFERLKEEVFRLKKERDQAIVSSQAKHDRELDVIKQQLNQIGSTNQGTNFNSLREELQRIKGHETLGNTLPTRNVVTNAVPNMPRGTLDSTEPIAKAIGSYAREAETSNLNRLVMERANLLKQGYLQNDHLILQLDNAIQELSKIN